MLLRDAPRPHYRPLRVVAERILQPLEVAVAAILPPAALALEHIEVELRVVVAAAASARMLVVGATRAAKRALFLADRPAELAVAARVARRLRAVLLAARALVVPVRLLAPQVLALAELDVRIEGALVRILLSRRPPVRHVARVARRVQLQVIAVRLRLPIDARIVATAALFVVVGRRSVGPTAVVVFGRGVSAALVNAAVVGVALALAARVSVAAIAAAVAFRILGVGVRVFALAVRVRVVGAGAAVAVPVGRLALLGRLTSRRRRLTSRRG